MAQWLKVCRMSLWRADAAALVQLTANRVVLDVWLARATQQGELVTPIPKHRMTIMFCKPVESYGRSLDCQRTWNQGSTRARLSLGRHGWAV